jgi:hypothetical protein
MAGRTISASYAGGLTLAVGDSPVTVTATGTVANANAAALMTVGTADWVIGNAGTIAASGTAAASVGIQMNGTAGSAGGTITNEATGVISGGQFGIYSAQSATLTNVGTVSASGAVTGTTTITPTAVGVVFGSGRVDNLGGISGTKYGVYIIGAGSVTNAGTIAGAGDSGVVLNGGGVLLNSGTAASITGGRLGAYLFANGTVVNSGSIGGTGSVGDGVLMTAGGVFENQPGGRVTGTRVGVRATGTIATPMTNAGTLSGGGYGVLVLNSAVSLTNAATGTIVAAATTTGAGIGAGQGGSVGNAGSISGRFGVLVVNAVGTATNSGIIRATGKSTGQQSDQVGAGIQLRSGGTITNQAGATISGYWIGAQIGNFGVDNPAGGAVLNAGTITANDPGVSGAAVWFKGNGLISNAATGTIAGGPFGIVSYNTVTVANRGRIAGDQFAVFTSTLGTGNRIIVYPGASFGGTVLGDKAGAATPTGVLELAAGGGAGTIVGFGTSFQSFGRVQVDAGATWSLGGTVASGQTIALAGAGAALTLANPGSVAGVITGFDATTQLVLGGISDVTGSSLGAGNVLTLTRSGGGTIALRFDPAQSFPPGSFGFSAGAGGTSLSAPCFALGTRIATPGGEVAVEALAAGMQVRLARGGVAEVVWVGHRRVECRHHPRPEEVWPVRVAAGAFGRGMPSRDLLLSPDHAVFAGGVLIPVRHLVNGRTVRQEPADSVTYFHVELAAHDVLLAEGLACESYLDTGNRAAFANGGGAVMLHADFARRAWAAGSCAPLVEAGPEVAAVRARLLARAGALGHRRGPDPGLSVLAEGRVLSAGGGRWREVALPAGARAVAIASRRWVPAEMEGSEDARPLGVAVGRVLLDGAAVPHGDARFGAGWHAPEGDWRWSDGMGWLHLRGARQLRFEVAASGLYWLGDAA